MADETLVRLLHSLRYRALLDGGALRLKLVLPDFRTVKFEVKLREDGVTRQNVVVPPLE